MDFPTYLLAHHRLARVQMMAWGHPTTSGISTGTMDYFVTHAAAEKYIDPARAQSLFTERLVALDARADREYRLPIAIVEKGISGVNGKSYVEVDRALFRTKATDRLYAMMQSTFK